MSRQCKSIAQAPYMSDLRKIPEWFSTLRVPHLETPLNRIVGFHHNTFFADSAHSLYMGHARDHIGTMFVRLARRLHPTDDLDAALSHVWLDVKVWAQNFKFTLDGRTLDKNELMIEER